MRLGMSISLVGNRVTGEPVAPSLATLDPYATSSRTWEDVPYGGATWNEPTLGGQQMFQVMDIWIPAGTAPANGWPLVTFFHANGNTHKSISSTYVTELLAQNLAVASVEFRHPVTNVSEGAPHNDVGTAIQFIRGYAGALDLDVNNIFASSRSRGALILWESQQADRADAGAPTWFGRQSSRIQACWAYNPQTTYSTTEFANTFIVAGDRAAFLAANPDDVRWGSAIQSVATSPTPRAQMNVRSEFTFPAGQVAGTDPLLGVHYPGFTSAFRDAYIAAGDTAKMTATQNVADADAMTGAAAWFASKVV